MSKILQSTSVILCCALAACASSSSDIAASYVSPITYQNYTCQQLSEELQRISARVQQVSGTVDSRASNDKVAMGVGMVIFWPALFFLKGDGPEAQELGRLKGEYDAVEEAGVRSNCGFNTPKLPVTADAAPVAPTKEKSAVK